MLDTQLMAKLEEISRQPSSPILPDLQGDIQEVLVNCQVHRNSLNLPPHTSECMEMLVVCRGTVTELIEGKQLPLKAGDILLSSPYTCHGVLPASPDCLAVNIDVTPYFFDLTGDIFRGTSELSIFLSDILRKKPSQGQYVLFNVLEHLPIRKLLDALLMTFFLHPAQEGHPWTAKDRDRIASGCVSSILFYLYKEVAPQLSHIPLDECLTLKQTVQNYIETNYRDATLRELAQLANCAESTLSRNILKLTGHSFSDLLQEYRFNKAKTLLSTTMLPIADIAAAVGYECYSFFYRRFRERYGCTPAQYRRRHNDIRLY